MLEYGHCALDRQRTLRSAVEGQAACGFSMVWHDRTWRGPIPGVRQSSQWACTNERMNV
jgi:hypothetical protein